MGRTRKEAIVLALLLAALTAVVYGPHAIDGGFLGDDWATRAAYVFSPHPGFFGTVGYFLEGPHLAARPLNAVYRVALNEAFGSNTDLWFAWQAASCVLMAIAVYLLLRRLDLTWMDAGLIATLILIFPAANSILLWTPVNHASLTIAAAAFGFLLALSAFDAVGRRRLLLHCASLTLFVVSLLLYEVVLPLMLASVLLYRLRAPWRQAAARWLLDCAVLIPIALIVTRGQGKLESEAGSLSHAETIYEQALTLLAKTVLPFGGHRWYALGLIALLAGGAGLIAARRSPSDPVGAELRRWLAVLAAGLIVVVLGYMIFVPGLDFYTPLSPGVVNRINAVPSIGWVLVLYSLIMLAATMAFRASPRGRALVTAVSLLACALIGAGWLRSDSDEADRFTRGFREGQVVLASVRAALPNPLRDSTVWTFGQPVAIAPGVPVFANTWDMTSSVQLMYGDRTLRSFVAFPGTTFACRPDAIEPGGPQYDTADPQASKGLDSAYGTTYFVETTTGRWKRLDTPAQCRRASASFQRSPIYPGE